MKKENKGYLVIPDAYLVNYAPTERAKCKSCHVTLYKGSLRLGRKVRSAWHDGFDTEYRHFTCGLHYIKHPNDISGLMDLRWDDIQSCVKKICKKPLDENNQTVQHYRARQLSLWKLKENLMAMPMYHLLNVLKINNLDVEDQIKLAEVAHLVADGILFGTLPKCPLCDHFCLRQSGPFINCNGYLEGSNSRCHFTFTLHNLYDLEDPPDNRAMPDLEPKDLKRKQPFLLTPFLFNAPSLIEWRSLTKLFQIANHQSVNQAVDASQVEELSECESEGCVPQGKELLGFTFTSIGLTPNQKKTLRLLIDTHGGCFIDKVGPDASFLLIGDDMESVKHTKQFTESFQLGLPILHYSFVNALVSREKKIPSMEQKKMRLESNPAHPTGIILRQRRHMKFYLKAGQLPQIPYPTVKSLLGGGRGNHPSQVVKLKKSSAPAPLEENAAILTIDPWFNRKPGHRIYVDENNIVYNCTTLYNDITTGINKFYNQQLIELPVKNGPTSFWIFRRWGRVGADDKLTNDFLSDHYGKNLLEAKQDFEKRAVNLTGIKWSEKDSGQAKPGRYRYILLDSKGTCIPEFTLTRKACTLPLELLNLMEWIFNQEMIDATLQAQHIDIAKMPLGRISQEQIQTAYKILQQLENLLCQQEDPNKSLNDSGAQLIHSAKWKAKIIACTTQFYSTIPHSFPLECTPPLLDSLTKLRHKTFLLDNLMDISIAGSIMKNAGRSCHPLDAYYKALDCELKHIDPNTEEYQIIATNIKKTHGITHSRFQLHVIEIFSFERRSSTDAFLKFLQDNGDFKRCILWHGSRVTNFPSILKLGLRTTSKNAPLSGYMFGKGVYFTDTVTKAAQYCRATSQAPFGLLVLSEVALGPGLICFHANPRAEEICGDQGKFHTWGVGQTPFPPNTLKLRSAISQDFLAFSPTSETQQEFLDLQPKTCEKPSLLYNEYIVYNTILMRFIVKVVFKYKALDEELSSLSTSSSDDDDDTLI